MGFWECRRSKEHQKLHRLVNFQVPIYIYIYINVILGKRRFLRALQHRAQTGPEWDPKGPGDGVLGWSGGLGLKDLKNRDFCF